MTKTIEAPPGGGLDDPGTRWSSLFSDPQWIRVDLGASVTVCGVTLTWEAAYARACAATPYLLDSAELAQASRIPVPPWPRTTRVPSAWCTWTATP